MVRALIRRLGYDIRRYDPAQSEDFRTRHLLRTLQVDLILDVGANRGQSARYYRGLGYSGAIVSFEPVAEAHAAMLRDSRQDPGWHVAPRMAIGERSGDVEVNVAGNLVSSSVLPIRQLHVDIAPESAYVGVERVTMMTLDDAARDHTGTATAVLLKLDVQGYEAQVLDGARETLRKVVMLHSELSLANLYDGQPAWQDMVGHLSGAGFELYALAPGFRDPRTARILQMNALFVRRKQPERV